MSKIGFSSAIIILAFGALNFTCAPATLAQDQSHEDIVNLLTNGVWHFEGNDWSNDRVFQRNGTVLVRAGNARGVIKWKIASGQVNIIFEDHIDVLYLPIDPKGTKGMDEHGNDILATIVPGSAGASSGPPSALDSLRPMGQPAGAAASSMAPQTAMDVTGLLISKKWRFDGANWTETRVFKMDGTMTIEGSDREARWQIAGGKVVMAFKDHKDILMLPLDPKGTKGMDEYGRLVIATQVTDSTPATAAAPASSGAAGPAPGSGSSYFGNSNGNGPATTATPAPQ